MPAPSASTGSAVVPETDFDTTLMCEAGPMNVQTSGIQTVLELGGEDPLTDSYLFPDVFDEFTTFVECAGSPCRRVPGVPRTMRYWP